MARLATVAAPRLCRRVRCRFARHADDTGLAESFRFLPSRRAYTVRNRPAKWRFALASRVSPTREPKRMDLKASEFVSISAFRSLHLSSRDRDHSRFVPNVFRVCQV